MKKSIVSITLVVALFSVSSAQAGGNHPYTPPVITGSVSGFSNGGSWAGGTGPNLQTLTQSRAWTTGSIHSQNLGYNTGWSVSAGFSNIAQGVNGGNGPSSVWTGVTGSAGFTVIPPSMPHHNHHGW